MPLRCRRPSRTSAATTITAINANAKAKALPPVRLASQIRASAVSPIGRAIQRRNAFIHGPGLGIRRRSAGIQAIARKGRAMPSPSAPNSSSAGTGGNSSAAPIAAAMNGPVHGVAAKAASRPVAKAPCGDPVLAKPGTMNS